jgi:hypothetical protein
MSTQERVATPQRQQSVTVCHSPHLYLVKIAIIATSPVKLVFHRPVTHAYRHVPITAHQFDTLPVKHGTLHRGMAHNRV